MKHLAPAALLAASIGLAACSAAVSEAELAEQAQASTAKALGVDVSEIEITSVERGATSSSWSANYDGAHIACSGNEKFQLPDCRTLQETASN